MKKCSSEIFTETLLVSCLRSGEFYQLLEYMFSFERYQNKLSTYYVAIGKYLEKNGYSHTLYDFQLLMKVKLFFNNQIIFFLINIFILIRIM